MASTMRWSVTTDGVSVSVGGTSAWKHPPHARASRTATPATSAPTNDAAIQRNERLETRERRREEEEEEGACMGFAPLQCAYHASRACSCIHARIHVRNGEARIAVRAALRNDHAP
jgi:hypothetical protein